MTERVVKCGDVDGKGTGCLLCVYTPSDDLTDESFECAADGMLLSTDAPPHDHPCHCNDFRLAALAKQDGELCGLLTEYAKSDLRVVTSWGMQQDACAFCGAVPDDQMFLDQFEDGGEEGELVDNPHYDVIEHKPNCLITRARAALRKRGVEIDG